MPEQTCPRCGKSTLTVWEETPLSITYICSSCDYHFPPKKTALGSALEVVGPVAAIAGTIFGIIIGSRRSKCD